ncbi:MAG: hypothetical protein ACK4WB_02545, partial [Desulfatiglandales bacterium]
MTKPTEPIDLSPLKRSSLESRPSLVSVERFARPYKNGMDLKEWLMSLPEILAGRALREVIGEILEARKRERPVILGMGAHVLKVGLGPIINQLMEAGIITSLAMNGACIIHDTEIAMSGKTSEDVKEALKRGEFGMAKETSLFINSAIKRGQEEGIGLGEVVSRELYLASFPFSRFSVLHKAYELKVPVTVHVAVGTDIIHMAPEADGSA